MPSSSRPGAGRSRGTREPIVSTTASNSARSSSAVTSRPTSTPQRTSTPSARSWAIRRSTARFSILKSGTPKRTSPPPASSRSKSTTRWPTRRSCWAAAIPAGPPPTTATLRPVSTRGGCGATQPSSHARSMIAFSICLIVTASPSLISSTHAASHGAGHSRPVNSGKLFVACSWMIASCQRPRYTRSFQSGIRLPSGQPLWQNGTPHSMHRAPWAASSSSGRRTRNSLKARSPAMRCVGSSYLTPERSILRKPPSSPIAARLRALLLRDDARLAPRVAARAAVGGRDERVVDLALRGDEPPAARALRVVVVGLQRLALELLGGGELGEHALVVGREDLDELLAQRVPLVQHAPPDRRVRAAHVLGDEVPDLDLFALVEGLDLVEHRRVDPPAEGAVLVEDERQAAAHAGGEVAPGRAEHDDAPAGHVLAAMVADPLDEGVGARVAHREALAGAAAEERASGRRAVEHRVADDHVVLGRERHALGRAHG